jgi:hypothetical protein
MGYSEKYDLSNYSDEENKLINEVIQTFGLEQNGLLTEKKNKYLFKTGLKQGNYPTLKHYMKENRKHYGKIKFKEGGGSFGGKCRGSGGFAVEWAKYDELNRDTQLREMVKNTLPEYKQNNITHISKRHSEDTRRPIIINNNNLSIGSNDIKNISDLTVHFNDMHNSGGILFISEEYISQKSTGLVTFINAGVQNRDCFPIIDIQNNNIQTEKGKMILKTLGINARAFCSIFNNYNSGNISENTFIANENNMKINFKDNIHDKRFEVNLKDLIIKSMGDGNSIISHYINGTDKVYRAKDKDINLISYASYYGGKYKKSKRIDIEIKTNDMIYTFNIRNKQGGIYPSHLMCDFKYHNDQTSP